MGEPQPAASDPTETDLHMRCAADHRWVERWPLPMSLDEFAERMRAVATYPTCGAETYLSGPKEKADV